MKRDYIEAVREVPGIAGSSWLASEVAGLPSLEGDRAADVLVVGGGITGALVARRLAGGSRSVILLERRRIASGTTGHSTAKVTALHGDSWRELLGSNPREDVRRWASANLAAVGELWQIGCDLGLESSMRRVPAYLVAGDDRASTTFDEGLKALVASGLPVTPLTAPDPFGRPSAVLADQVLVDPAAFVLAVVSLVGGEAEVYERTSVRELEHDRAGWRATCDRGTVRARVVVMADHFPLRDTAGFFTRLFPYAHHALEIRPHRSIPDGMWMQVGGVEITLRPTFEPTGTWIAGGQRSRVASVDDERDVYGALASSLVGSVGECEVLRHWSAHDHETPDGLPFIGHAPLARDLFMAAGFAGWGMTKSFVAAEIIADAIEGRVHPLAELVSPSRVPRAGSAGALVRENGIVGREFMGGHLTTRQGKTHEDSMAGGLCTHLGCVTQWNTAEGTVDCPCHGSRFSRCGDVLYGPARRDIGKAPKRKASNKSK